MKQAHTIAINVFAKGNENVSAIRAALMSLVPFDLEKEKLKVKENVAGGKDVFDGIGYGSITVLDMMLEKERHTTKFIEHLKAKLSSLDREQLATQENRVDDDCHFYLRLDKKKLLAGEYALTESGDCFHVKMSIAAFPKKREVALGVVRKIFT